MKYSFKNRLAAIDWIAANAKDEAQFEALREQLNFNHIYYKIFFVDLGELEERVLLGKDEIIEN
ncbi:MAG: hypothetical protein ACI8YQ_000404 [Polaribacter sp.]|jgi:hypothetical protein